MGSVASQDSDLGPRAASKAEVEVPIEAELVDEEVHSKSTATDDLFPRSAGSASETAAREHQLGLDINYPWGWGGSKYNDYDLVTVHGIRDDYRTAWIDRNGAWWAKDILFKDLFVREVDYSYEIDQDSPLYAPDGLRYHAQKLIAEYAAVRSTLEETETDRPIIWICHDLGGAIVKEALLIALNNPTIYGKIALLTSAIIFLGTPHRFQSVATMEDQLHKLIFLPGPEIESNVMTKVRNLAKQVKNINESFLATKLLDRAAVFNIFSQNIYESRRVASEEAIADDDSNIGDNVEDRQTITPFSRYTHLVGQSFESYGRIRVQPIHHIDLVRGDPDDEWVTAVSEILNTDGCVIKADYRIIKFQAHILALSPPTRGLSTPFDPVLRRPPCIEWISEQQPYKNFSVPGTGLRILHLHGNGNGLIDIPDLSRLIYIYYNSAATVGRIRRAPDKTVIYFEFDKHDSRYNTISSFLTYLINVMAWNFWTGCVGNIIEELGFLLDTKSWTVDDLYHVFTTLRDCIPAAQRLTIFIGCFDQCPKEQGRWFLDHVLQEQAYTETEYRIILTTTSKTDLASEHLPKDIHLDFNDCPGIIEPISHLAEQLRLDLGNVIEQRPIYEDIRPLLEDLLQQCTDAPHLGQILLTWLRHHLRGKPTSALRSAIAKFNPVTAARMLDVLLASLDSGRRARAEAIFNWIKYAREPWSPESLVEAMAVNECDGEEPSFNDLDIEGAIQDMEDIFCGIIIIQNRDVKFSHPSFYNVPAVGLEGSEEEQAAKVHRAMATACLHYFQFASTQEKLLSTATSHLADVPWIPENATLVFHVRTSMAEYAIRFWPHHYENSGSFKPAELVHDLFNNKQARASWEILFWLMSNPYTRMQQSYISTLPVFAMLGLKDLVEEKLRLDKDSPGFERDCWLAITEATRSSHDEIVLQLLEQVTNDDKELSTALFWATSNASVVILDSLLKRIICLDSLMWTGKLMHRAAASGLDNLLLAMLKAGCDSNETYEGTLLSPVGMAASRNRVSTMRLLLNHEPKPDLYAKTADGDSPLKIAISRGSPTMMDLVLEQGGSIDLTRNLDGDVEMGPVQLAVKWCRHKTVAILIKAGADFKSGFTGPDVSFFAGPPLIVAADQGLQECVRLLLDHHTDVDVDWSTGTALYNAVAENRLEVVKLLLQHEPKPDMDVTPEGREKLLIQGVTSGNTEIVSLLIKAGAQINFVDTNCSTFCKTPLSRACYEGDMEMVKLLLQNGADINYTGDASDAPLFTAFYENEKLVGKFLLEHENVDLLWAGGDGMGSIHAAFNHPDVLPILLKRGVPIDSHGIYGTALHMAARDNYPESVKVLLENDPKPNLEYVYGEDGVVLEEIGYTPLQLACSNAAPECVKILLEAGADPVARTAKGDDAVDILIQGRKYPQATEECLALLLAKPYNLSLTELDPFGKTRLHKITIRTTLSMVRTLVEGKTPLDFVDDDGYTPLALAITRCDASVAMYLIEQGADPRVMGSGFGSILHLAVRQGSLKLVKRLMEAGADFEKVHPDHTESLLHAALGITNVSTMRRMVRYLVDEAKFPVDKFGGEFGYPIIRAAFLIRMENPAGLDVLKFLIRRKAQLNVADSQGRRAVHLVSTAATVAGTKALVAAGADINVRDKFGRLPIHFAASSPSQDSLFYLLDKYPDMDIDAGDYDKWTPLLWAARSGDENSVLRLVDQGANLWTRGTTAHSRTEWSALKLINFANFPGRSRDLADKVVPKELYRTSYNGGKEYWDEYSHKSKPGHITNYICDGCLVSIVGMRWRCIECKEDWSLCFKCSGNRAEMHNPQHSFEEVEPWYDEPPRSSSSRQDSAISPTGDGTGPEIQLPTDAQGVTNGFDPELNNVGEPDIQEPDFDLDALG